MTLGISKTVKSILGNLVTQTGAFLVATVFFLQVANTVTGTLTSSGGITAILGNVLSLVLFGATIVVALGAFRSLNSGELEKKHFTDNLTWPIIRLAGVNLVITAFAVLAFVPLAPLSNAVAGGNLANAGTAAVLVGVAGLLVSFAAFFYAVLALALSLPEVAVRNNRMFEALDNSVRKTKGHKKQMMAASVPVIILYGVSLLVNLGASNAEISSNPVVIIVSGLLGSLTAVTVYSTLIELDREINGGKDGYL
ncbi:MAG: hypothetical protein BRC29_01310 [Nanohaloarchaea archaeon SW_7_43_1]|nr:MAG: hypothetical protein BRC29_01310 [Nanohaloarchaea archaeon SW_7_43_1]